MTPHRLGNFAAPYQSLVSAIHSFTQRGLASERIAPLREELKVQQGKFMEAAAEYNRGRCRDHASPLLLNQILYLFRANRIVYILAETVESLALPDAPPLTLSDVREYNIGCGRDRDHPLLCGTILCVPCDDELICIDVDTLTDELTGAKFGIIPPL